MTFITTRSRNDTTRHPFYDGYQDPFQIVRGLCSPHALWTAPAERGGDGALDRSWTVVAMPTSCVRGPQNPKAAWRFASRRTPKTLARSTNARFQTLALQHMRRLELRHSAAAPAALECGDKRGALPLFWPVGRGASARKPQKTGAVQDAIALQKPLRTPSRLEGKVNGD
jgi:hypothetical protein